MKDAGGSDTNACTSDSPESDAARIETVAFYNTSGFPPAGMSFKATMQAARFAAKGKVVPSSDSLGVQVSILNARVEAINVVKGSFDVRFDVDMYWTYNGCGKSTTLVNACQYRVSQLYFARLLDTVKVDAITTYQDNPSDETYKSGGMFQDSVGTKCISGDFNELQATIRKTYDMSNYPYEAHELGFTIESRFSTEFIQLFLLDEKPKPYYYQAPSSYTVDAPFRCKKGTAYESHSSRGGEPIAFDNIYCRVKVSTVAQEWLLNEFVFFFLIILTNLFASLNKLATPVSFITGGKIDDIELPLQVEARAVATGTLFLAYIFAVTYRPHGEMLSNFDGDFPPTYLIYALGLAVLGLSSVYNALLAWWAISVVRDRHKYPSKVDVFAGRKLTRDGVAPAPLPPRRSSKAHDITVRNFSDRVDEATPDSYISTDPEEEEAERRAEAARVATSYAADDFRRCVSTLDLIFVFAVHFGALVTACTLLFQAQHVYKDKKYL